MTSHAIDENLEAEARNLGPVDTRRGQARSAETGLFNVIEADDCNLLRHGDTSFVQKAKCTESQRVVERQDCVGRIVTIE